MMADLEAMDKERRDAGEMGYEEPQGTGDKADVIYSRTSPHDSKQSPESIGGNENSGELKVEIEVPKENQERFLSKIEEQKDKLEKDGVNVETGPRSITITFTQEKGHVVTGKWIKDILLKLFDDILQSSVSIQKQIDKLKEELERLSQKTGSLTIECTGVTGGCVKDSTVVGLMIQLQVQDEIQRLKAYTKEKLESQTRGMIKMSAVDLVMKKLQDGQKWITITGNAGEGKTTLGYLVLQALDSEEDVYIVDSPKELSQLYKPKQKCTILLNDIFGQFNFDQSSLGKWNHHVANILEDHEKSAKGEKQTRIIFISRCNVLNSAQGHLERHGTKILAPECVIDLSTSPVDKTERIQLLDYHLKDLSISSSVKDWIAGMDTTHGFPHCCKMYAELKSRGEDIDITAFFKSPLKFLDKTTEVLMTRKEYKELFRDMIKSDGQVNPLKIKDDEKRYCISKAASELNGSYIKKMSGHFMFTHPSIHESVVNVIGKTDSLFIVKHASISVIMQLVNIKDNSGDEKKQENIDVSSDHVDIDPVPEILDVLCDRFRDQVLKRDFSVFDHKFCDNQYFCERLVSTCVQEGPSTAKKHKKGGQPSCDEITSRETFGVNEVDHDYRRWTMLHRAAMGGRLTAVGVLLEHGADVTITDEDGMTSLHHLCMSGKADTSTLQLLITHDNVNLTDKYGMTALHHLCMSGKADTSTLQLLITHGADVNLTADLYIDDDMVKLTALQYLCRTGEADTSTLQLLITHDNVNQTDKYGRTALHHLCESGKADTSTLQLLITHGADVNLTADDDMVKLTALQYLCRTGKADTSTLQLLITHDNVNLTDGYGMTALHHLCESGKADTSTLQLLITHDNVNLTDEDGMTALHHLCIRGKADTSTIQVLMDHGADVSIVDVFGRTALDRILAMGEVDDDDDIVQLLTT